MAVRLTFPEKQIVQLENFALPDPIAGEVLVQTSHSLMSTGTENILFNQDFAPGTPFEKWFRYPIAPGYLSVGHVSAMGDGDSSLKQGDAVFMRVPHASHHVVKAEACIAIPEDIAPDAALWCGLAKIAFRGAFVGQFSLGGSVVVVGAGPIGQMVVRWAKAAGMADIVAVDLSESRLALACSGGATQVLCGTLDANLEEIQELNDGDGPPLVVDTTDSAKVLEEILGVAGYLGRVVLLGNTGFPADQRLTPEVVVNGLTIIGAHDRHDQSGWDTRRITNLFFNLVTRGDFDLSGLNTHRFQPKNAADAYALANSDRGNTLGILFDWA